MKYFIHLNDFSMQEIFQIFELADKLKADNGETVFVCVVLSVIAVWRINKHLKME